MKVAIRSCGTLVAMISAPSDELDTIIKMIVVTIADDYESEFDMIEDIIKLRIVGDRRHFYWGGENGDLYLVTFE